MDDGSPWSLRYVLWSSANWLFFLAAVAFLTWGSRDAGLPAAALALIIMLVGASVAGQFTAAYRLVGAQDEYIRGLSAKRSIAAAGVTITCCVLWGLAQQFLAVPRLPMWLAYPLFWGAFGLVTPFIRSSRA